MSKVIMYMKPNCPYCDKAKTLLNIKKINDIIEINIKDSEQLKDEMIAKSNGLRTVPQIFINGTHVGGFDALETLNNQGKLDHLLKFER